MNTSDRICSRFDRSLARIRPSQKQLADAYRQVTYLKENLCECVKSDNQFYLEKILLAGSTAKHTNLVRAGKYTFDIDLGVYFRRQGHEDEQLSKLLSYTHAHLRKIYPPEKLAQDFHKGKNAVNLTFHTSKLKVDIVPIVRDGSGEWANRGWIPREDEWRLTSITSHIQFIHKRTALSNKVAGPVKFNDLVRLMKWWNRRLPDGLKQCSYFCELITAAAFEGKSVTDRWQTSLSSIFGFLSRHAFERPIIFSDYYNAKTIKLPSHCVVVLDAVNSQNNVTRKWTEATRRGYLKRLQQAYQSVLKAEHYERQGDEEAAVDAWCDVFGKDFRQLST